MPCFGGQFSTSSNGISKTTASYHKCCIHLKPFSWNLDIGYQHTGVIHYPARFLEYEHAFDKADNVSPRFKDVL